MRLPAEPSTADRVWLVWRASPDVHPVLLGGGRIVTTDEGRGLWTNRTLVGVVQAARRLGYGGPTNMTFLHLTDVEISRSRPAVDLGDIAPELNFATTQQVRLLEDLLPIR
jgi:hypothetical protein